MKLPSAVIIPNIQQGTAEWFAARAGKLTASRFAQVLTPTGKLSAQADALARKLARECVMPDPQEFQGNRYTEWGQFHEPAAREAFAAETGFIVDTVGFCVNKQLPVLGCSPDGLIRLGDGYITGLEIKCPAIDTLVEWLLSDGTIPKEYMPQVHGSMVVTGLQIWHFCGYHPGAPLYLAHAVWNDYTDKLAAELAAFAERYYKTRKQVLRALGKEVA